LRFLWGRQFRGAPVEMTGLKRFEQSNAWRRWRVLSDLWTRETVF
jgi:hypothetical protein